MSVYPIQSTVATTYALLSWRVWLLNYIQRHRHPNTYLSVVVLMTCWLLLTTACSIGWSESRPWWREADGCGSRNNEDSLPEANRSPFTGTSDHPSIERGDCHQSLTPAYTDRLDGANEEFRAVWVSIWDAIKEGHTPEQNRALGEQIMDNIAAANMNALFWHARRAGTVYYPSAFEPWGKSTGYASPGYDPLAHAVEQAHARGLEIHAWFNVFQAYDTVAGSPGREHPEWICHDQTGTPMSSNVSLSPGLPAVRNYLIDVAMEIVTSYDIDGLHLDYVRWNESKGAHGRFLYDSLHPYVAGVPTGHLSWDDWRRWAVTELVRELHEAIQQNKPHVRLSVAVLGKYDWSDWQGYATVYQDAALWFNRGYVEQLLPMHYHWRTGEEFYQMLAGGCPQCWCEPLQTGILAGRLFTVCPGSYKLSSYAEHAEIVEVSRAAGSWIDGFSFFSYANWRDSDYGSLAAADIFARKTKIRPIPAVGQLPLSRPSCRLEQVNRSSLRLIVEPKNDEQSPDRFIIYRSHNGRIDPRAEDTIIAVRFSDTAFWVSLDNKGGADATYYVTAVDRFWNESEPCVVTPE